MKLMIINVFLQFLFVRLAEFDTEDGKVKYMIVGFTWPLTGWWSDYKHIGELWFLGFHRS
jgi:hypothetical protein